MKIEINDSTSVKQLEDEFKKEVGATLRVYDGRSEADKDAKLVSLGAKEGTFEFGTNRTVGSFCEAVLKNLNLKVKVKTADDWVEVLDGLTLNSVKDLPKQTTKKVMEDFIGYERVKQSKYVEGNSESCKSEIPKKYKKLPLIVITTKEINFNDEVDADDFASFPALGIISHGYSGDGYQTAVFVEARPIELKNSMVNFIQNKISTDEDLPVIARVSNYIKGFGKASEIDEMSGALLTALNEYYDSGNKHYMEEDWDSWLPKKIIFSVDGESFIGQKDGSIEMIDLNDKEIESLKFSLITSDLSQYKFHDGMASFEFDEKYGYVNDKGEIVIPHQFEYASEFNEGLAAVKIGGLYGYIDLSGKPVTKFEFEVAKNFNEGLAAVKIGGLYGYIDLSGKPVTKFEFEVANNFNEGLAIIQKDGLYGTINTKGEIVIPIQYESMSMRFNKGKANVKKNGRFFEIDTTGKEIV